MDGKGGVCCAVEIFCVGWARFFQCIEGIATEFLGCRHSRNGYGLRRRGDRDVYSKLFSLTLSSSMDTLTIISATPWGQRHISGEDDIQHNQPCRKRRYVPVAYAVTHPQKRSRRPMHDADAEPLVGKKRKQSGVHACPRTRTAAISQGNLRTSEPMARTISQQQKGKM